jgi:hypothetical protein
MCILSRFLKNDEFGKPENRKPENRDSLALSTAGS